MIPILLIKQIFVQDIEGKPRLRTGSLIPFSAAAIAMLGSGEIQIVGCISHGPLLTQNFFHSRLTSLITPLILDGLEVGEKVSGH